MLDYGQQGAQAEESHGPPAPVGGVGVVEGVDAPEEGGAEAGEEEQVNLVD